MDAFLIARIVRELSDEWVGAWIQGVWQDTFGRLCFKLRAKGHTTYLVLSPLGESPGLGLIERRHPSPPRPAALVAYLRAHAKGARLLAVQAPRFDRVVEFVLGRSLGEDVRLYFEATGRRGNLVAADGDGLVRAVGKSAGGPNFGAARLVPGKSYQRPRRPGALVSPDTVSLANLTDWLTSGEPLHRRVFGLSPVLAKEITHRADVDGAWEAFRSVVDCYGDDGPLYAYPGVLSAVPLAHLGPPVTRHSKALCAAGAWLDARLARAVNEATSKAEHQRDRTFRRRLERRLVKIQADLDALPDPTRLRHLAEALAVNLPMVESGAEMASVPDPRDPARTLQLNLDPSRSPGGNLDRLYRQARKVERTRQILAERMAQTREELEQGAPHEDAHGVPGRPLSRVHRPFRRFLSSDGWPIWVGRNASENDRLLREARPWDLWLHARDARGAHVLVWKPGKESRIPDRTLIEAAGLAALHSNRSGEGAVDVMVTEAGRVRKPRGTSPGQVQVTGGRTLRVPPGAGQPRLTAGGKG